MLDIRLYQKKIISDTEFPVELFTNHIRKPGIYFEAHWHEHIEMHYVMEGKGIIYCNQKPYKIGRGSFFIINSNELHEGISEVDRFDALVIIFKMDAFSKEVADLNVIFQSLIEGDEVIQKLLGDLNQEVLNKSAGYKLAMRGIIYELITYLLRNYVAENLSVKENIRRTKNLERLNQVLQYIENNYMENVSIAQLAELIHLSEYRFCHLFKESVGKSPINYINEVRLKNAHRLLEGKELTITEVATTVGFQDYNNFGRLFRKYYGYSPSQVWES